MLKLNLYRFVFIDETDNTEYDYIAYNYYVAYAKLYNHLESFNRDFNLKLKSKEVWKQIY